MSMKNTLREHSTEVGDTYVCLTWEATEKNWPCMAALRNVAAKCVDPQRARTFPGKTA